jgi:GNAT superfamily N-acetyltransferase
MTTLVAEESVARMVAGAGAGLVVVPRVRRRRAKGWEGLDADRVVDALVAAGPRAVVLARGPEADPGGGALPALGRVMGHRVVRLPGDVSEAAWTIAVAVHPGFAGEGIVRRLEALAGIASAGGALPRRAIGPGRSAVPALRPAVLGKWAACAWRACARCPGGGAAGARCGRCGAPIDGEKP